MEDITQIKNYEELPENCKKYIEYIENKLNCNVSMVSVGPERSQNIYRHTLVD
jgi:adenylosuccinate synthase